MADITPFVLFIIAFLAVGYDLWKERRNKK